MIKIKWKDITGFMFGLIFSFGVIMIVFSGCSRPEDIVEENITDVQSVPQEQRELKIGMSGGDVLYLHEKLHEALNLTETEELMSEDEFGEETQYYVSLFQATQDIEPDGVVSVETWTALENPLSVTEEEIAQIETLIPIDDGDLNVIEDESVKSNASGPKKVAYLTFDDGPNPTYTPQIMSLLKKYNAGATFFALGQEVDKFPNIAAETSDKAGVVANHTYTHLDISKASDVTIKEEIIKANTAVKNATGKTPICFRPPYGAINPDTKQKIGNAGGKTIMWDVDTQDWARPGTDVIVEHVLSYTQNGEIILMHDGGGDRTQTVAALEKILKEMTAQNWEFKTLNCVQ